MDDITIDENYDAVKEEFFKGLTFRQTVYAFLTILGGTATYTILLMVLHLPQIAALYLAVLIAVPVAANGFVEIHGLTILEFVKRYREIKKHPGYLYISEESPDFQAEESAVFFKKKKTKQSKSKLSKLD